MNVNLKTIGKVYHLLIFLHSPTHIIIPKRKEGQKNFKRQQRFL